MFRNPRVVSSQSISDCCVTLLIKRDPTNTIAFDVKIAGIVYIQYNLVLTKFEGKRSTIEQDISKCRLHSECQLHGTV